MTITVGAGTSFDRARPRAGRTRPGVRARSALARRDDRRHPRVRAVGPRRLRHGPVRDHVLEVRFETGDGRLVKGGGPTVKNVTGYDLPRLFVGSLGTIGVLHQATLRCRPRFPRGALVHGLRDARVVTARRPDCGTAPAKPCCSRASRPTSTRRAAGSPNSTPRPSSPTARTAGRISVAPAHVRAVRRSARRARALVRRARRRHRPRRGRRRRRRSCTPRSVAHAHGGWMLREAGGAPDDDGFGRPLPNAGADAADQGRVRSRGVAQSGPVAAGARGDRVTRAAAARRRRAERVRLVRPLPPALPDLSRHRAARSPRRGAASRRCARSRPATRRSTMRSAPRWRNASRAAAARPRARPASSSASSWRPRAAALPAAAFVRAPNRGTARLLARAAPPLAAARVHVGRLARAAPAARPGPPRSAAICRRGRSPDRSTSRSAARPTRWLFTGCVMDAWLRDTHRAAARVMRATGAAISRPGSGGACCGALHLHAGRAAEARSAGDARDARPCRATRRSWSTAPVVARR